MSTDSETFTIDVRRLRVLLELDARGTIGATAAALYLTPSAVSQQIASLSRELKVPLLVRHGRGVGLTPQAQLLLEHAVVLQTQLERALADLAAFDDGLVGHVALGAFATAISAIVAPALTRLRSERPRLRVSVVEVEAPECFRRLDRGDLDLVVTVDFRGGPHHGDPRYARCDLLIDPFDVALPAGHALTAAESITLKDLADEGWIVGAPDGPCGEVSLAACNAAGFNPDTRHKADDWGAVLALVAAGCGVSLVPRLALSAGAPAGVIVRALNGPARPVRNVYVAARAGAEQSPSIVPLLVALQLQARTASLALDPAGPC